MDSQRQQVAERIKQSNNILVTVSSNPSVDQLAACIGLTLSLNKMGKHATAVFSGSVPSTLEFLQPEKTIEKNTDSLRDFIISLDKSKADKLRYKVEDKVVKIFITPYRTSISDRDLEFSQGDFNVDVVVALGVHQQADLDQAITAHGRILHDATVATVNVRPGGELGSINWLDINASSLSELAVRLVEDLDKNLLDAQISTAFLTGIVAETERFSNAKTSPQTMSVSAELMTAGANQQLVATKLEEPVPVAPQPSALQPQDGESKQASEVQKDQNQVSDDGTLEIAHDKPEESPQSPPANSDDQPYLNEKPELRIEPPEPAVEEQPEELPQPPMPEIHIDESGALHLPPKDDSLPEISHHDEAPKMDGQPADTQNSSPLTANTEPEKLSPSTDPLTLPPVDGPLLSRDHYGPAEPVGSTILPPQPPMQPSQPMQAPVSSPAAPPEVVPPAQPAGLPASDTTLSELERQLHSDHAQQPPAAPTQANDQPVVQLPDTPALNANPTNNGDLSDLDKARSAVEDAISASGIQPLQPVQALNAQPLPLNNEQQLAIAPMPSAQTPPSDTNSPPPVPPPMMPPMPPIQQ